MAALSVAIKADPTAVLPVILAAAFTDSATSVTVDYKDVASLGEPDRKVEVLTESGARFSNAAVLSWLHDVAQGAANNGDKRQEVCSAAAQRYELNRVGMPCLLCSR